MAEEINIPVLGSIALNTRSTYQYNNSAVFYSLVNSCFLPYYQTVIRKSQEWLDGYDPQFHKDDMVSSRIAAKLINGFKTSVFGQGLVFFEGKGNTDQEHKALNFISHEWADESNIQNALNQCIGYTLGLGTSALKLNKTGSKYWTEGLRADYFYFSQIGNGRVEEFISFVRLFQSVIDKDENYFLVERRYFGKEKVPFTDFINGKKVNFVKEEKGAWARYDIYKYSGVVTANTMPSHINLIDRKNTCDYKTLPTFVKDALKRDYGTVKVGEPQRLPFGDEYLGVEIFKNEGGDITNPSLPFGRALVFDCLTDFMEYDMDRSYGLIDLYNSRGKVGIPRGLTQSTVQRPVPGTAGNYVQTESSFGTLNIPGYEFIPGLDPNTQKPIITQFEMRAQEHETKQYAILKSIAITVGVSPRAIASFLVQAGEKTDDQIQSEDDTITQWVKAHRRDYIKGVNRIVEVVLNQNGFSTNVEARFSNDGLLKGDKMLENISKRLELGMLTLEDAIREYYPDLDEVQLQEKIEKATAEQERLKQEQSTMFDEEFGDNLNENELNELSLPE